MYHAYFSQKAANLFGTSRYSQGDKEVQTTMVCKDKDYVKQYNWDDVVYKGEVEKYLGKGWSGDYWWCNKAGHYMPPIQTAHS